MTVTRVTNSRLGIDVTVTHVSNFRLSTDVTVVRVSESRGTVTRVSHLFPDLGVVGTCTHYVQ